jgi:hypothetical protein
MTNRICIIAVCLLLGVAGCSSTKTESDRMRQYCKNDSHHAAMHGWTMGTEMHPSNDPVARGAVPPPGLDCLIVDEDLESLDL